MTTFIRFRLTVLFAAALLFCNLAYAAEMADPKQVWQLLDYLAVDYSGAVVNGEIVSQSEYAEMREFADTVRSQLTALPDRPGKDALLSAASTLSAAIASRRDAGEVSRIAHHLADDLLIAYPVPVAPKSPPNLEKGRQLFTEHCSGCHGITGAADGPVARTLDPPPIAFTDHERARQRSPFGYYEVISQGVAGTSMASYKSLTDEDRWALAFYASTLAYSPEQRAAGEQLWKARSDFRAVFTSLEMLTRTSEDAFAATHDRDESRSLMAFLRYSPSLIARDGNPNRTLALARTRLAQSVSAYTSGNSTEAQRLALSAYLDGVEPIEPMLATSNAALLSRLETAMAGFRASLGRAGSLAEITEQQKTIEGLLDLSERAISARASDSGTAFVGSLTILVREGLEALLVVVAIIAFLRRAQRPELLRYVHGGWIGALIAGLITWVAATYLVSISGANREVTEGASSIFAAIVLLSVGLWMHGKSIAGRWQHYLTEKLSQALSRRSVWFLAGLAFIAVYREVFETILFYAALWTEGQHGPIVAGLAVGSVVLAGIAYVLLRATTRLPIGRFFAVSSILVGVLSVILIGKGVAALQEAGIIDLRPVTGPHFELLGIFPNRESLLAQAAVLAAVILGFTINHLNARKAQPMGVTH